VLLVVSKAVWVTTAVAVACKPPILGSCCMLLLTGAYLRAYENES
jgi:hypothetical protein